VPLGESRPVPVDFRLCTATHRNLAELVAEGRFRKDLFGRISGFELVLPPLCERREDLGLLLGDLLGRLLEEDAKSIRLTRAAARALLDYDWPCNVRELEKALEQALALAGGERLDRQHLPAWPVAGRQAVPGRLAVDTPCQALPEESQLAERLRTSLAQHAGNISAVARSFGRQRSQIRRWLRQHDIDPEPFRHEAGEEQSASFLPFIRPRDDASSV